MESTEPVTHAEETPFDLYRRLLAERTTHLSALERRGHLLGWSKLLLAALELAVGLWFLSSRGQGWLLAPPLAFFVALAVWHEQLLRTVRRLRASVKFYERGLARLEDRWAGTGDAGERFHDASHPYARDLDLFDAGSLFELLSTVSTAPGAETLAAWLKAPAPVDEIRLRQPAVCELSTRLPLREQIFVTGGESVASLRSQALVEWAEQPRGFGSSALSWLAAALALAWLASVVVAFLVHAYLPVFLLTVLNFGLNMRWGQAIEASADGAEDAAQKLEQLARVLVLFETEAFTSEKLHTLQRALRTEGLLPSQAMRQLDRIVFHLEARRNPIMRVFDGVFFYSLQLAFQTERWRRRHGGAVRGWLDALGQMEALCALAGFAYEHPENCWPTLVENAGPLFEAEDLAHPLLPPNRAVRNDLKLGGDLQLIVLSGPNMAGKSTFIRGIGLSAVLAQCGAPVSARRFTLSPLAVGASICVLDSLSGGISRFYAEIQRLKLIVDLTGGGIPVLFLLDELLSGTNSFDRRKGTEFIVRALVKRGAIGLVTTHDLALTEIPNAMNGATLGAASNCHFEDRFEAGSLIFDYKLKPGVVETSNALKLMQSIGLPTEE